MDYGNIDPHKHPGPLEDLEKKQPSKQGTTVAIVIGLLVLLLGGGVALFVYTSEGGGANGSDDAASFIPFIPIWIAVFIPFIYRNKKKALSDNQKRARVLLAAALGILVATTFGIWFYMASG